MANFGKVGPRPRPGSNFTASSRATLRSMSRADQRRDCFRGAVGRFDGKIVAALNIGVQPEQVSAKAMIADYVPLLMREALALRERLV